MSSTKRKRSKLLLWVIPISVVVAAALVYYLFFHDSAPSNTAVGAPRGKMLDGSTTRRLASPDATPTTAAKTIPPVAPPQTPTLTLDGRGKPAVDSTAKPRQDTPYVTGKAGGHVNLAQNTTTPTSDSTKATVPQTPTKLAEPSPAPAPGYSKPIPANNGGAPATGTTGGTPAASPGASSTTPPAPRASGPLADGMRLIEENKLVEGRAALSKLLVAGDASVSAADQQTIRDTLMSVNKTLVFSKRFVAGDPLSELYVVQSGDNYSKLAPRLKLPASALEYVNTIKDTKLQVGQQIKLIKGPFHIVVSKRDFRLDLFLHAPDGSPQYVRSFPVGLGENNSTPVGKFVIRGKTPNPAWKDPRTNITYASGDPNNPIGAFWLRLVGTDDNTRDVQGYGVHGTIDKSSIGKQMSLGCIRMNDDDIAAVYKLSTEGETTVVIKP